MDIKPHYSPIGKFFEYKPVYRVPTYQRAYSWDQLEIEDFVRDLETCYNKRKYENPTIHFFGQIVCIEDELQGTDGHKFYELVDGQQRIATFILLVNALINIYHDVISSQINGNVALNNEKDILIERIRNLSERYVLFQKEVQQSIQEIKVLELSKRDCVFFNNFLIEKSTEGTIISHSLIKNAYNTIYAKILALTDSGNLRDRIGNLKTIEQILETDFCILNMVTNDRKAAFKLFQVLNNRGKNLTEGDLLRAECLRMLETHRDEQEIVEKAWDNILIDPPNKTVEYLRAIYSSSIGDNVGTNALFNEFIDKFLPEYGHTHISAESAGNIKSKVKEIEKNIATLRQLSAGEWPFLRRSPIEHWDCNQLYLLIHSLEHTECLPFLLSAQLLSQSLFSDITQMLVRFVFRYLIVGNQYIGDLLTIYHEEAKIIKDAPKNYTINNLKIRLEPLMNIVNDEMFKRQLDDLKYTRLGKSNKPLKYFLLSIEYYYRWYNDGAAGTPVCIDKERVYDFTDSTIEHIYPHNGIGNPTVIDTTLDPLKNTIGNLTILGNADNRTGDNDDFITKKHIFNVSSLMINRENIAQFPTWNREVVLSRTDTLKNMACAIFQL